MKAQDCACRTAALRLFVRSLLGTSSTQWNAAGNQASTLYRSTRFVEAALPSTRPRPSAFAAVALHRPRAFHSSYPRYEVASTSATSELPATAPNSDFGALVTSQLQAPIISLENHHTGQTDETTAQYAQPTTPNVSVEQSEKPLSKMGKHKRKKLRRRLEKEAAEAAAKAAKKAAKAEKKAALKAAKVAEREAAQAEAKAKRLERAKEAARAKKAEVKAALSGGVPEAVPDSGEGSASGEAGAASIPAVSDQKEGGPAAEAAPTKGVHAQGTQAMARTEKKGRPNKDYKGHGYKGNEDNETYEEKKARDLQKLREKALAIGIRLPKNPEPWQIQKAALRLKFPEGWNPRKKLSPDAIDGIRAVHQQDPEVYTTQVLANQFQVSAEAIRRILRSKWKPKVEEEEDRQNRWFERGKKVWSRYAELGKKPPKKWQAEGIRRDYSWVGRRKRQMEARLRQEAGTDGAYSEKRAGWEKE